MGDIGTPISSGSIPAVGTSGTTYASDINLFLTEVKARLEAQVPKTALEDGDLDLNASSLQNASYVGISDGASAPTTPSNSLQAFGGDLYWVNTAGAAQITSGNALNTASFGGITGDYGGANPAQFRFVDADQEYYAYDDFAGLAWARLWAKNFDLAAGATSSNRVRLAYGGATSYVLTFPSALPASTSIITVDTSGQLTPTNTLTEAVTAPDFYHTDARAIQLHPVAYKDVAGVHTYTTGWWQFAANTNPLQVLIPVQSGDRIIDFSVYVNKFSNSTNTLTARLESYSETGAQTNVATATNADNAPGNVILSPTSFSEDVTGTKFYIIRIFQDTATAGDQIMGTSVSITRPAP